MTPLLNELHEKRAEREGEVTPAALAKEIKARADVDEFELLAYVAIKRDGEIITGWSTERPLTVLGLFDAGKDAVFDDARDH